MFRVINEQDIKTNNKNKNNQDSPITPIKLGKNNNPADRGWSVKKSNKQIDIDTDVNAQNKPPPPVFVKGVEDFPELCARLIEIIGVENFICKSSADKLKIQTSNPESYRTLIHFLKDENAQYHTYQLRENKLLRIVIRNLHSSTPIKAIKEELEFILFEVRQVTNVLHKVNKNPLPLFFVDLEPTPKSKEIFELSSLLHTKIRIEEPYKSKVISQCLKCQEYGHTRTYCGYHPRCVRCEDSHQTSDCPNPRDAPPKCALCSENHPANYKGCSIYRELQRRKKPTSKSNIVTDNIRYKSPNIQSSHLPNDTLFNKPPYSDQHKSYAHITSNQSNNHAHSSNPIPPDVDVNKII
ncbi:hypothetical protein AGLY_000997 [Aphis glycines]|uniref:Pre-C2HC domain-containing protein n=1 Tax=Aphis glycines TaxID=307491 RepID=A0A6G0U8Q5_APHGL|nr:hypothetical protein AGLY_000997 [Aphis glycines]